MRTRVALLLYLSLSVLTLLPLSCRMHPTYTERIRKVEKLVRTLDLERQALEP